MNFEYRVRWQREGKQKRIKIYQNLSNAEKYVDTLNGEYPMSEREIEYFINLPILIEDPIIEKRPVGIWDKT